ncbi:hypothetical protein [Alcanivorax profundi]|uniref:hypothetical protein n=1 Tax=Alcanivorax profundi TaxID=2338368 RepID=UPI0032B0FF69
MKAVLVVAMAVLIIGSVRADTGTAIGKALGEAVTSDTGRAIGEGITNTSQATLMTILCNGEGMFSKAAQCYMTPSGKRVWELEGEAKSYWMRQAMADGRHRRMEEMRQQRLKESHKDFCTFWLDQEVTERSARKIDEYCH